MSSELKKRAIDTISVPHSLEELWGYFKIREDSDPTFMGYSDIAAEAADAIETARSTRDIDSPVAIDIALIPGRSAGIYTHEFTRASKELQELLFAVNNLVPIADETSDKDPTGRIWWRSLDTFEPVHLIETRGKDIRGYLVRLTAVSDIPTDLALYRPNQPYYPPETERAIKKARAMQKLATRAINEARDDEVAFYQYVRDLPETTFESPFDQAA